MSFGRKTLLVLTVAVSLVSAATIFVGGRLRTRVIVTNVSRSTTLSLELLEMYESSWQVRRVLSALTLTPSHSESVDFSAGGDAQLGIRFGTPSERSRIYRFDRYISGSPLEFSIEVSDGEPARAIVRGRIFPSASDVTWSVGPP